MRLPRSLLVCAATLSVAAPALVAQTTAAAPRGAVTGSAYDSVSRAPLAGAFVQMAPDAAISTIARSAFTDSAGRFRIDSLAPGTYLVGIYHERLDSLDVALPLRRIEVAAGATTELHVAVPMLGTIASVACGGAPSDSSGRLMGRVYDARALTPLAAAAVRASWFEIVFDSLGLRSAAREETARTSTGGGFVFCDLPAGAQIALRASEGSDTTGAVVLDIGARSTLRRDLFVGRARAGAPDSASVALLEGVIRRSGERALANAQVRLTGSGVEARTDSAGRFRLAGLPAGTQMVEIRAVGYLPEQRPVDLLPGRPARLEMTLVSLRALRDTIRVTAQRIYTRDSNGFERRRRMGFGRFIDAQTIARRRPGRTTQLFETLPGVRVSSTGRGEDAVLMRALAAGYCRPTVVVDRMRMRELSADDINMMARPEEIAGVEVYTSATQAPAEFASTDGCGVIVIWTRPPVRPLDDR